MATTLLSNRLQQVGSGPGIRSLVERFTRDSADVVRYGTYTPRRRQYPVHEHVDRRRSRLRSTVGPTYEVACHGGQLRHREHSPRPPHPRRHAPRADGGAWCHLHRIVSGTGEVTSHRPTRRVAASYGAPPYANGGRQVIMSSAVRGPPPLGQASRPAPFDLSRDTIPLGARRREPQGRVR